jgi:hypothetical protein
VRCTTIVACNTTNNPTNNINSVNRPSSTIYRRRNNSLNINISNLPITLSSPSSDLTGPPPRLLRLPIQSQTAPSITNIRGLRSRLPLPR